MRTQLSCSWLCWLIMSAWGILWLELQSCSEGSGMRFLLNRACVIRSRARRSRAFSVMDGAVCLHKRHGASAERKGLMDAVTFFGNKRGRKIHQEQQDPRTLFMRTATDTVWNIVQLFEANGVARRNYFWANFRTDNFLAWFICAWLWFFIGVSYLHVFKGRSLVENAWNGHQTIVWEDFWLFSANNWCL